MDEPGPLNTSILLMFVKKPTAVTLVNDTTVPTLGDAAEFGEG